jgi:hypothetical protein
VPESVVFPLHYNAYSCIQVSPDPLQEIQQQSDISKPFHGDGRDKQKRGDDAEKIGSAIGAKALKQG